LCRTEWRAPPMEIPVENSMLSRDALCRWAKP
jgi:hypothetical protein